MTFSLAPTVVLVLLCLFFFAVGVISLLWPEKIQEYALNLYTNAKGLAGWNPFLKWMQTSGYIVSLRLVGALAILAGLFALYDLVRRFW